MSDQSALAETSPQAYRGNPHRRPSERAERTAQRSGRLLGVLLIVSMILNVVLVSLLTTLFPLVRVQPALVQFSDRQFYKIEPIFKNGTAEVKAREAFARRYVQGRETINLVDDSERWEWVAKVSHSEAVWQPFINKMTREGTWKEMDRNNVTQRVRVLGSWSLQDDSRKWAVEFERQRWRSGEITSSTIWVATIALGQLVGTAGDEDVFDNPLRLRIDRYTINAKDAVNKEGES